MINDPETCFCQTDTKRWGQSVWYSRTVGAPLLLEGEAALVGAAPFLLRLLASGGPPPSAGMSSWRLQPLALAMWGGSKMVGSLQPPWSTSWCTCTLGQAKPNPLCHASAGTGPCGLPGEALAARTTSPCARELFLWHSTLLTLATTMPYGASEAVSLRCGGASATCMESAATGEIFFSPSQCLVFLSL